MRMLKTRLFLCLSTALVAIHGCGGETATSPSTTISAPRLLTPTAGAQLADASQPVTLVIENATSTGKNALVYTFEVATDAQFTAKAYTKAGVAQGTDGKTSQTIDKLPASKGYYWRARAEESGGQTTGPWATALAFSIGASVRVDPPMPVEPLGGAEAGGARPMFTIRNATSSGATGAMLYTFEVSESAQFTTIVAQGTQVEDPSGKTKWFATADLGAKAYYWRVRATDTGSNATSANSEPQAFRAHPDEIDLRQVSYTHGPDISQWPVTVTLTRVTQGVGSPDEVCTYFTHQGEWPPVIFYGELETLVEGNQWYFARINGRWHGVPGEWFRPGVACKFGQSAEDIGKDSTMDEPMHSWRPRPGELVGYGVSTPARNYPSMKSLDERSQVILAP